MISVEPIERKLAAQPAGSQTAQPRFEPGPPAKAASTQPTELSGRSQIFNQ